jgi:16S rRNA (adenine1518-N6/adenine1519-N6)-dimethyltransferase
VKARRFQPLYAAASHEGVRAKKGLGQHFLRDAGIAADIADLVLPECDQVVEIGPGTGVLTRLLYPKWGDKLSCVELDKESVQHLSQQNWAAGLNVVEGDFLQMDMRQLFSGQRCCLIGNYPYNISTQIAFAVVESNVPVYQFAGMFQREVALRLCAAPGNKDYGITSVLLQAYYDCQYSFTVEPHSFEPPPKVRSGVMTCTRKSEGPEVSYKSLKAIVKMAFNQRRKTLSNALKPLLSTRENFRLPEEWAGLRAEQLAVKDFIALARIFEESNH